MMGRFGLKTGDYEWDGVVYNLRKSKIPGIKLFREVCFQFFGITPNLKESMEFVRHLESLVPELEAQKASLTSEIEDLQRRLNDAEEKLHQLGS